MYVYHTFVPEGHKLRTWDDGRFEEEQRTQEQNARDLDLVDAEYTQLQRDRNRQARFGARESSGSCDALRSYQG